VLAHREAARTLRNEGRSIARGLLCCGSFAEKAAVNKTAITGIFGGCITRANKACQGVLLRHKNGDDLVAIRELVRPLVCFAAAFR
jgi:hypothetical protein